MKVLLLAALALAGCAPSVVETAAPGAPVQRGRARFYRFHVLATASPVVIRRDLALEEIAKMPGAAGKGLKTQGLTLIKHALATHTSFKTSTGEADTAVSAWFDDVILEVSVSSTVIFIPREYPPGTCEYETVLIHEREHGKYARVHAAAFARELEDALSHAGGLPTRSSPIVSTDYAAVADALKTALGRVVDPVYARYEKEEVKGQDDLDRPDPYDAVYRRCSGWR